MKGSKKTKAKRWNGKYKNDKAMKDSGRHYTGGNKYSEESPVRGGSNDPSWYTRNNQLALDAGRIAFTWPTGNPFNLLEGTTATAAKLTIPGVLSIETLPLVGISVDGSSPINTAAKNIYSYVRHANSGHANYDAPDYMMFLLAMDSLYSIYAFMARAYGVISVYSQRNRYLPEALFKAMGLNFSDFLANIADFRYYINSCAVKIGSLCVPNSFTYFTRHQWMYSGIYQDSPDPKAQLYMYTPRSLLKYDESVTPGRLGLIRVTNIDAPITFNALKTIVDGMISVLMNSEDIGIMSGDTLKAFGQEGIFKLAQIAENFVVVPEFNDEVLRQIQNATVSPNAPATSSDYITQDSNGNIICNPSFSMSGAESVAYTGQRLIAGSGESPSPEQVLVTTRLTNVYEGSGSNIKMRSGGSDIAVGAYVIFYKINSNGTKVLDYQVYQYAWGYNGGTGSTMTDLVSRLGLIANLGHFHYHPMTMDFDHTSAAVLKSMHFEVDNYAIISELELQKLHETSLLSMFSVPQLGSSFA